MKGETNGRKPMPAQHTLNDLAVSLSSLGKSELKKRIRNFKGRFKLDFPDDYLEKLSPDKLRHILLAALMTKHRGRCR